MDNLTVKQDGEWWGIWNNEKSRWESDCRYHGEGMAQTAVDWRKGNAARMVTFASLRI